jgi:hypothetical protein
LRRCNAWRSRQCPTRTCALRFGVAFLLSDQINQRQGLVAQPATVISQQVTTTRTIDRPMPATSSRLHFHEIFHCTTPSSMSWYLRSVAQIVVTLFQQSPEDYVITSDESNSPATCEMSMGTELGATHLQERPRPHSRVGSRGVRRHGSAPLSPPRTLNPLWDCL